MLYYEKFLDCKQGWLEDNIAACQKMAECYEQLNQSDKKLQALFRTMSYDLPRAETCCGSAPFFSTPTNWIGQYSGMSWRQI